MFLTDGIVSEIVPAEPASNCEQPPHLELSNCSETVTRWFYNASTELCQASQQPNCENHLAELAPGWESQEICMDMCDRDMDVFLKVTQSVGESLEREDSEQEEQKTKEKEAEEKEKAMEGTETVEGTSTERSDSKETVEEISHERNESTETVEETSKQGNESKEIARSTKEDGVFQTTTTTLPAVLPSSPGNKPDQKELHTKGEFYVLTPPASRAVVPPNQLKSKTFAGRVTLGLQWLITLCFSASPKQSATYRLTEDHVAHWSAAGTLTMLPLSARTSFMVVVKATTTTLPRRKTARTGALLKKAAKVENTWP